MDKITTSKFRRVFLACLTVSVSACQLTVTNNGGGTVTSDSGSIQCGDICQASYSATTTEVLKAEAAVGYVFDGWTGACQGAADCQVTIGSASGNKAVTAHFRSIIGTDYSQLPYSDEISENAVFVTGVNWNIATGISVKDAVKPGERISVAGKGFSGKNAENTVVFSSDSGWNPVVPDSSASDELVVRVPSGAKSLFVVRNGIRTNLVEFSLLSAESPVLSTTALYTGAVGGSLQVAGQKFSSGTVFTLAGKTLAAQVINEGLVTLQIPLDARSGNLQASNGNNVSNVVAVRIDSKSAVHLVRPQGVLLPYENFVVSATGLNDVVLNQDGIADVAINTSQLDYLQAVYSPAAGNSIRYLMGWTLPGMSSVEITSQTTAEALVAMSLRAESLDLSQADALMKVIGKNPDVVALGQFVATSLQQNPLFFKSVSKEYLTALDKAINSVLAQAEPTTTLVKGSNYAARDNGETYTICQDGC